MNIIYLLSRSTNVTLGTSESILQLNRRAINEQMLQFQLNECGRVSDYSCFDLQCQAMDTNLPHQILTFWIEYRFHLSVQ